MRKNYYPSFEYVCQCFREEDGRLFWKHRPIEHFKTEKTWKRWNSRNAGEEAGYKWKSRGSPRHIVSLNKSNFYRSQIVWLLHHGQWADRIDHKNRDATDDRIGNLRPASASQNGANSLISCNNTSGFKGVSFEKRRNHWRAYIKVNRRFIHLGSFPTPEEAHAAYLEAARQYFGEFATSGVALI